MRKLILISAFALASVAAQAGEIQNLVLAANDAPAATTTTAGAPTADAAKPQASSQQASKSNKSQARRETDEQKARRIAAKYGISW